MEYINMVLSNLCEKDFKKIKQSTRNLILLPIIFFFLISLVSARDLDINKLNIIVGENNQFMSDEDTFRDVILPGDKIEFVFELKNNMYDTDIKDILITVEMNNITQDENIKEDISLFDLNRDKTKTKSLKLKIPDNADEIVKTAKIKIKGVDDDNFYEIDWNIYFKIEDEKRDITLYKTLLNQTKVNCSGSIQLLVWIENSGKYDESKAVLEVEIKKLDIYERYTSLDIKKGTKYTKIVPIEIDSINQTGKIALELRSYYKTTYLDDIKTLYLDVIECKKSTTTDDKEEDIKPNITSPEEEIIIPELEVVKSSNNMDMNVIILVFVIILIILIIIIALSVIFLKKL
jgi:hypothetical protein